MPHMPQARYPEWTPETNQEYDELLSERCARLIGPLKNNAEDRNQFFEDPRAIHHQLYRDLTPVNFTEYAGNYRGSHYPSLNQRITLADSDYPGNPQYRFLNPEYVSDQMASFSEDLLRELPGLRTSPIGERTAFLTHTFLCFGYIHPFLNGNGHVQRIMFELIALELGFRPNEKWSVHPRPYGDLLSIGMELYSKNQQPNQRAAMIRGVKLCEEYLCLLLETPVA